MSPLLAHREHYHPILTITKIQKGEWDNSDAQEKQSIRIYKTHTFIEVQI